MPEQVRPRARIAASGGSGRRTRVRLRALGPCRARQRARLGGPFAVGAGSHTFYVNGVMASGADANDRFDSASLVAVFYPA